MHSMIASLPATPVPQSPSSPSPRLGRLLSGFGQWWMDVSKSRAATELLARADRIEGTQPGQAAELREAARLVMTYSLRASSAGGANFR